MMAMLPQFGRPPVSAVRPSRLAFVLPVINPLAAKVSDYQVVQRMLREAVRSLTSQTHQDVVVVLVCHGVPAGMAGIDERVHIIDVGDHPAFAPNRNHVRVDKGMKYALGCLYAIGRQQAGLVMLGDADDFVRIDLAQRLIALLPDTGGADGFLIRRGLELLVRPDADGFSLCAAFEIDAFNRGCGTCRIFRAGSLETGLRQLDPGFFERVSSLLNGTNDGVLRPTGELLDYIEQLTNPIREDESGFIRILGRHTRQAEHFRFRTLDEPLAAKSCGHGNHDSGYKGDIVHWGRINRLVDLDEVLARFGLASSQAIRIDPDTAALRRARRWITANRLRGVVRGLLPPRRKY